MTKLDEMKARLHSTLGAGSRKQSQLTKVMGKPSPYCPKCRDVNFATVAWPSVRCQSCGHNYEHEDVLFS